MGLVDPNAPTQIDPARSSHYDAYGNPIESAPYVQPAAEYVQVVQPVQPVQPVEVVQPHYVGPVQPVQYMQPVEPVEPVGHPHYVQPIEPVQPVQPVQPVAHPHYVQPVEPVQPVEAVPPLQPKEVVYSQPVAAAQAVTPVQPVQQVEPGEPLVPANRAWDVYRTSQVIYFALAVLETLLVIRIILRLLAANPSAPFTALVYGITYPFVALFSGVFPSPGLGSSVLELSSLLALVVYPLVAWLIVRIIHLSAERNSTV